ncbi:hypothetical protein BDZ89DRAFT_1074800 [Hymenopellis radicata]|nr:hypothetical protein BDZ89DRAFT_1074800 [Hymenopellis radicata]
MNNYPIYSNVAGSTSASSSQQRYYGELGGYSAPSTPPRSRHASSNAPSPIHSPHALKPYSKSTYSPTYAVNMMNPKGHAQRVKSAGQVEQYIARARGDSICFSYQTNFLVNLPGVPPPPRCKQGCLLEYKDAQFPVYHLPDFVPIAVVDPSKREELKLRVLRPREMPHPERISHYIPFKDRLDITEGGRSLGISMAQLLAEEEMTLEKSLLSSSDHQLPDVLYLQIRLNGYGITTQPIFTRCAHGELSHRSLAIVISRIYASILKKPADSSVAFKHKGCEGLPIPKFNELRLIALYRAKAATEWHTEFAYVAKPQKSKARRQ